MVALGGERAVPAQRFELAAEASGGRAAALEAEVLGDIMAINPVSVVSRPFDGGQNLQL